MTDEEIAKVLGYGAFVSGQRVYQPVRKVAEHFYAKGKAEASLALLDLMDSRCDDAPLDYTATQLLVYVAEHLLSLGIERPGG